MDSVKGKGRIDSHTISNEQPLGHSRTAENWYMAAPGRYKGIRISPGIDSTVARKVSCAKVVLVK